MKIKILKSDNWYKDYVGTEFEVSVYYLTSLSDFRFSVFNHGWVYVSDCVITELPESFCVKRCNDGNKWGKYIQWLNKTYNSDFVGEWDYYGVIDDEGQGIIRIPFGIEIHIDDMIKHIEYMERHIKGGEQFHKESQLTVNMNTQKLSRQGLKEIHSIACSSWKITLEGWGSRNPLEDYIILSQKEIDMMFNASDNNQKSILSKYLKQDDGSVYLTNIKTDSDSNSIWLGDNCLIAPRTYDEYGGKAFCLNDAYKWEIKTDDYNQLCLIPTKKK